MVVTLFGIVILVNELLPTNAYLPMLATLDGIVILVKELQ